MAPEILHLLSFIVQAMHSRMGIKLASRGGLPSDHTSGALLTSSFLSNAHSFVAQQKFYQCHLDSLPPLLFHSPYLSLTRGKLVMA